MIYLLLHILGNTVFLLAVRVARQRRHYLLIGATNYVTAFVLATIVLVQSAVVPSWQALALGSVQGVQYQTMFLLLFVLLGRSGVAVVVALLRLSVAIPTVASIVIWQEYPSIWQGLGLVLAAIALPLLSAARRPRETGAQEEPSPAESASRNPLAVRAGTVAFVALVLLLGGMGLLAAKTFAEMRREEQRPAYNFGTFATATLLSAISWPLRHRFTKPLSQHQQRPSSQTRAVRIALALGVATGITNIAQIELLLRALVHVSGTIAFPLTAAATQVLTAGAGWLFWREPLRGRAAVGVAVGLVAAVLMNVR
ncbi:MAG: hypothetical protein CL878_04950 [Dehalococcoidia bacterium]|nr:hypothetical protein [Dehalococcoidia bacterium]